MRHGVVCMYGNGPNARVRWSRRVRRRCPLLRFLSLALIPEHTSARSPWPLSSLGALWRLPRRWRRSPRSPLPSDATPPERACSSRVAWVDSTNVGHNSATGRNSYCSYKYSCCSSHWSLTPLLIQQLVLRLPRPALSCRGAPCGCVHVRRCLGKDDDLATVRRKSDRTPAECDFRRRC